MRWSLAMGLLLMSLHNNDAMAEPPDFDAAWDFGDPAGTEQRFREMVPAVQAAGDADLGLQLQTQIARTEGLQQRYDEALSTLDAVDRSLTEATPIARLRATLERGRVHNSSGSPVTAVPLFEAAFEMARRAKRDGLAVDAAHMVAIASGGDTGHRWNLKALALAEASRDPKAIKWKGSLYNNIGWYHHDAGRFDAALATFQKGLAFRITQGKTGPIRIARWTIARIHRSLGQCSQALPMLESLAAEWGADNQPDGYVYEELGECLLALDRTSEASPHFRQAYALLSKDPWMVANEPARLERLQRLGSDG